jgi:hypothetical protein
VGGMGKFLMLGCIFGTNFVFFIIKKRLGDKYTRRLDRIFVHIAVPVFIFTLFGFFQKAQINNVKKEFISILDNRIHNETAVEKKNYNQVTYGELAPILQMVNDRSLVQAEKEKEYLNGLEDISQMIKSENLCDKRSRDENKDKLDILLQGIEKYKAWMHSEFALREELLKKLGRTEILKTFRETSQTTLPLNDELMDSYRNLVLSTYMIISFADIHQKNLKLVNKTIKWDKDGLEEDFAALIDFLIDDTYALDSVVEKQIAYEQQMLEKAKGM